MAVACSSHAIGSVRELSGDAFSSPRSGSLVPFAALTPRINPRLLLPFVRSAWGTNPPPMKLLFVAPPVAVSFPTLGQKSSGLGHNVTDVNTVVTARRFRRELRSRRHKPLTYYAQGRDRQRGVMALEKNGNGVMRRLSIRPLTGRSWPYSIIASLAEINEYINDPVTWGFKPMDHMIH